MADIRVFPLSSEGRAEEDIYSIAELAETADGVLVVGSPGDAEFWENLYEELERIGARWPRIRFIDRDRDTALSSLSLEELLGIWKEYLEEAAGYVLHVTVDMGRELSRRDLVKRGLSLALRYAPLVDVDAQACGLLKHCSLCLPACPHSALRGKPPEAVREKCLGCGACASSCPSGLLYQPALPPAAVRRVIEKAAEKGLKRIVITCPKSRKAAYEKFRDKTLVFEAPCVASFRLHEYLYAKLKGISVEFLCARETCSKELAAKQYLELIGEAERVLGKPLRVPEAARLLPVLASSFELKAAETELRLLPLFSVKVDAEKCSLCGACSTACPTKALLYREGPEGASLLFDPSLCIGCASCSKVCPEAAITLERKVTAEKLLAGKHSVLSQSDAARCRACGAPVGPLARIKTLERRLREKKAPQQVLDGLYLCSKCKVDSFIGEIAQQTAVKK